jgi:hypothetical protein
MELKDFVLENQKVINLVKDRTPGNDQVDMYYGTLDYATARFNTILLILSQDKVKALEHESQVVQCFEAIQSFYKNVQRYRFWPWFTKPIFKTILHGIGTNRIPKIKKLLEKISR